MDKVPLSTSFTDHLFSKIGFILFGAVVGFILGHSRMETVYLTYGRCGKNNQVKELKPEAKAFFYAPTEQTK